MPFVLFLSISADRKEQARDRKEQARDRKEQTHNRKEPAHDRKDPRHCRHGTRAPLQEEKQDQKPENEQARIILAAK